MSQIYIAYLKPHVVNSNISRSSYSDAKAPCLPASTIGALPGQIRYLSGCTWPEYFDSHVAEIYVSIRYSELAGYARTILLKRKTCTILECENIRKMRVVVSK